MRPRYADGTLEKTPFNPSDLGTHAEKPRRRFILKGKCLAITPGMFSTMYRD